MEILIFPLYYFYFSKTSGKSNLDVDCITPNDGKNRRKIMLKEEIDGVSYVYVPKDLWDRMWEILDRLEELGNKYGKHS